MLDLNELPNSYFATNFSEIQPSKLVSDLNETPNLISPLI